MKITIYTTADCPFSKSEKDYLSARGQAFEEKDVQANRAFLSEMLDVSDKFAGVPFTVVVKDDGSTVKLRGFTKEEFDSALGIDPSVASVGPKVQAPASPATTIPATPTSSAPTATTTQPTPQAAAAPTPTLSGSTELHDVMNNLSNLSNTASTSTATPSPTPINSPAPTVSGPAGGLPPAPVAPPAPATPVAPAPNPASPTIPPLK